MVRERRISSHPLEHGPLTWAVCIPDGQLQMTNKATLATTLQKNVTVAEQLPGHCDSAIDETNLVQEYEMITLYHALVKVLSMALKERYDSDKIDRV